MIWLLLLQEFDITVINKAGKDNAFADFLSSMIMQEKDEPVDDKFPHEHLFATSIQSPWFADLANYLATGKCPNFFNLRQRKKLIRESSRYTWIGGLLFRHCPDHVIR